MQRNNPDALAPPTPPAHRADPLRRVSTSDQDISGVDLSYVAEARFRGPVPSTRAERLSPSLKSLR